MCAIAHGLYVTKCSQVCATAGVGMYLEDTLIEVMEAELRASPSARPGAGCHDIDGDKDDDLDSEGAHESEGDHACEGDHASEGHHASDGEHVGVAEPTCDVDSGVAIQTANRDDASAPSGRAHESMDGIDVAVAASPAPTDVNVGGDGACDTHPHAHASADVAVASVHTDD
jgi:hypothetical protein